MLENNDSTQSAFTSRQRPAWLAEMTQSIRLPDHPALQKLRGTAGTDAERSFDAAISDAALQQAVQSGIKLFWVPLFSGLGLEFEKELRDRLRDFSERARSRGLKIAACVSAGALATETLLLEESEAQNWMQIDQSGQPIGCTPARPVHTRPCFNTESYLRYMERVCAAAVESGADLVQFEDIGYAPEPHACRCPICVAAFREMLRAQYGTHDEHSRHAGLERFGYNIFIHTRPPHYSIAEQPARGPHEEEWTKFKVQTVTQCLERLARAVIKRNPNCGVSADLFAHFNPRSAELHGIDYKQQLPLLDAVTDGGAEQGDIEGSEVVSQKESCAKIYAIPYLRMSYARPEGPAHG